MVKSPWQECHREWAMTHKHKQHMGLIRGNLSQLVQLLVLQSWSPKRKPVFTSGLIAVVGNYSFAFHEWNERYCSSWYLNTKLPQITETTRRIIFHPDPKSALARVWLQQRSSFEAAAEAVLLCLCDSSIRGVCHLAIIQSHLKCSPLGSNTTLGSNK